jgi:hypothetical protein
MRHHRSAIAAGEGVGSGEAAQAASRVALTNKAIPTPAKRFNAPIGLEGFDVLMS